MTPEDEERVRKVLTAICMKGDMVLDDYWRVFVILLEDILERHKIDKI